MMATIRQNTPRVMAAFAVVPEFFHSPNTVPHPALAITAADINTGQPTTGPSTPILATPAPYTTILPSHKPPITAGSILPIEAGGAVLYKERQAIECSRNSTCQEYRHPDGNDRQWRRSSLRLN